MVDYIINYTIENIIVYMIFYKVDFIYKRDIY